MMSAPYGAASSSASPSPRRRGRIGALALTTACVMGFGTLIASPAFAADVSETSPVDIDIVTINDFHGRIEADGAAAGAAVLSGAVNSVRDANPNTVFAAAGDLIGASTFTSFINSDNPTIDALNAAGLEVSAAGNHEFDQGWEDLRDRVQPRADWEYISSNVFVTDTGDTALAPAWVKEVEQGVRVGFIGAVTEDLDTLVRPQDIADLEVRSIVDSVNAVAADLTDGDDANGEADVLILLVHEGASSTAVESITPDSPLGEIVNGVDQSVSAIVSAHTHLAYNHVIDGRPVVSAGQYGENFGLMNLQVDPESKELLSITNEIKPLTKKEKDPVSGKDIVIPLYEADADVQAIVDDAAAEAEVLGAEPVGAITGDFNRARQTDGSENRGGESTIGNFVADVQQWATGADIALMNPGGIRTDLTYAASGGSDVDGSVSFREAATVQPFANTLVTLNLTGAQVKSVLEEQWQPDGSSRPFLKLGVSAGLQYAYDPSADAGERITSITLNGESIDPEASYLVAANSFLAGGGDNFSTLAEGTNRADTGKSDLASMVDWFAANGTASPELAQRAVGVVLSAPDADGYSAGDEVTVDVSSLAFSGGDAVPSEVSVSLGDAVLATGAVDAAVVDATDEAGRASVAFTVPEVAAGEQQLIIATPDGTSMQVPITIRAVAPVQGSIELGATSVVAGGTLDVSGSGFEEGADLVFELRSTPVEIGTATVAADGTFAATVTIPKGTPAGEHTIAAIQPDGTEVTAAVTITAPDTETGNNGTGDTDKTGDLATTGADSTPYLIVAVILLVLGAVFMIMRRRSRTEK